MQLLPELPFIPSDECVPAASIEWGTDRVYEVLQLF